MIVSVQSLLLVVGGYYVYKNYVVKPKEEKATDAMFKAEEYYRKDSSTWH